MERLTLDNGLQDQRRIDLAQLIDRLRGMNVERRKLVAIAGAPGAGKSTFVETLRDGRSCH